MGLLSDPKQRQRIIDIISKYNNKLCVLCYVAGVIWFLALAYQPFNARTYFSENALLPGNCSFSCTSHNMAEILL
jgi:glycosylphosphatidylinositol transamidase